MGQRQGIPSHWGEGGECGRPGQYPHTGVRGNEWGKRQGIPSYWGERDEWGRPGPYPHTEVVMNEEESGLFDDNEEEEAIVQTTGGLTPDQKANIKSIYAMIDAGRSGVLTTKELRKGLQLLGLNPTVSDVKELAKKYNIKERKVSLETFEQIMEEELLSNQNPEFDLLEAFRIFDRDGNGTFDRKELKRFLTSMGEQLTDQEVDELFDQLDTDRSGTLSVMEASKLLA
ncbi:uncharacterized protein LOC127872435 [Dreissena polymorpha]|nr:uncharacterized protein LOC127872435 [Dreissena polymorpha]